MKYRIGARWVGSVCAAVFLFSVIGESRAGMEEARAHLDQGNFDAAYAEFMTEVRERPDDPAAWLGVGFSALGAGRLGHAQWAFERTLALQPDHHRARLELGRVYHALGHIDLAREQFLTVLRSGPPAAVEANVQRYLTRLAAEERRWGYRGDFKLSAFYDNNANFGPASRTVDTLFGPLQVSPESEPMETWGAQASLSAYGLYDLGERGGWFATGGLALYHSYTEQSDEVSVGFARASLGLRHIAARREIDLPVKIESFRYGGEDLMTVVGVEPRLIWRPLETWSGTLQGTGEYRNYADGDARDAMYYRAATTVTLRPGRDPRHALSLIAAGFFEDAEAAGHRNEGWEAGVLGEAGMPARAGLYGFALFRQTRYDGVLFPGIQPEARTDNQWQFGGGLRKRIGARWEADLSYRYITSESTFDLYDYRRQVSAIGVTYFFP
ncbi:MAG: tetratricopeptide repeat protein [Kiritimatiellia bacterium]|nr:tetratricopeptide repeat protein [Kiritimatiellia bacterium]